MQNKQKSKKLKLYAALIFLVVFIGLMLFLFSGGNAELLKNLFRKDVTKEEVRQNLSKLGARGYLTFGILSMLQVVFTFLPAEPVQVMSGISFGFWKGSAVCFLGIIVGNTVIYILYKIYGEKLTEFFENNAEFDFQAAKNSPKIAIIVFILYFLPAIPYGLICFFSASLDMKYPKYIFLTGLGALPSVFIGVGLGHMAIASGWILSVCVFAVLMILLVVLYKNKSAVFKKVNDFMKKKENYSSATTANKSSRAVLELLDFGSKFVVNPKIKVRLKNNVGKLERPAIVLINHGSFPDFVYAGRLLKKERPNFVVARLYFYKKALRNILKKVGCFPKSMFSSDMENVKNCLKVLSSNGVLCLMPEARLSTVGKFEGIQEQTYKFIARMNAAVYTIKINGAYLASPKWGDKMRKGSLVEASLDPLFEKGEAKKLPPEEVQRRIDERLFYDEFEWLKTKPTLHYKSKTLAVGLENILYLCPNCHSRYALTTKNCSIQCSSCKQEWHIDDRYAFVQNLPFENFAAWYAWQSEETEKQIRENPEYILESKVELYHASTDGKKMLRLAGEGICKLNRNGLTYQGLEDGTETEKFFPMSDIYRLLFGAGVDFEIYDGKEIWYFVPENKRSCVEWYVTSGILKNLEQ